MIQRNQRTMDVYERAGAEMRLLKTLGAKTVTDAGTVLCKADTLKLMKALDIITEVCGKAEDNMFSDHPELPDECTAVFYGASYAAPADDVGKRMRERMKGVLHELIEGKKR